MQKFLVNNIPIHSTSITGIKTVLENSFIHEIRPFLITTFNLDFLRITSIDKEFYEICKNSKYNLPDGFGITSLIRIKYKKNIDRITGNDLFLILLNIAKKLNLKVAIIGGTDEVSNTTEKKIVTEIKLLKENLLCLSPPYRFEFDKNKDKKIINKVSQFEPDITFCALGCPRQEKWLYKNMNAFGSKINVGIGATLDFFTGEKKRAPLVLQKIGLEWLWRLANEPKRLFKRYILQDLPFFIKIIGKIKHESK